MAFLLPHLLIKHRKRRHEAGGRTRIAGFGIADFHQAFERQPALEDIVKGRNPERQDLARHAPFPAAPKAGDIGRLGGPHNSRQAAIFNPCYGVTKGKNGLPLHGVLGHDGQLPSNVHVMFLWIPELGERVNSKG
ncbi:hypothetical protein N181_15090 [Sinorhizobium fredii USDA 205]|nr:hypothetical protein N181_15090 [Sinorhizobium fredii USDA 205]